MGAVTGLYKLILEEEEEEEEEEKKKKISIKQATFVSRQLLNAQNLNTRARAIIVANGIS